MANNTWCYMMLQAWRHDHRIEWALPPRIPRGGRRDRRTYMQTPCGVTAASVVGSPQEGCGGVERPGGEFSTTPWAQDTRANAPTVSSLTFACRSISLRRIDRTNARPRRGRALFYAGEAVGLASEEQSSEATRPRIRLVPLFQGVAEDARE